MVERRVIFPIIGDDESLQKDTRVILTNQQLITRNPGLQDEASLGKSSSDEQSSATAKAKSKQAYQTNRPKVSYSTQHRPLNSNHSGVSSFDKMPKKTSVDESKERAKRSAATLPERPKKYVYPLERNKEDVSFRRNSALLNQKPLNDNPIQDMKRRGLTIDDALAGQERRPAVPRNNVVTDNGAKPANPYFEKKHNLFERGNLPT